MYLVLDYAKMKGRESGYTNSIAIPAEELYVEDGLAKLPIKFAADQALETFGEVKFQEILPLDIQFQASPQKIEVKEMNILFLIEL